MRKWFLAGALLALMGGGTLTGATPSYAATFPDVPSDHWAYDAVAYLQEKGLVEGYPDNTFKGNRTLTRYEFAIVVARLYDKLVAMIGEGGGPAPDEEAIFGRLVDEFGADIEELRDMLHDQGERLGEMEVAFGDLSKRMDTVDKSIADRLGTVKMTADLRTRIEIIDPNEDGKDETKRARIRLRVRGEGKVNSEVKGVFRVATGGEGEIVSTNESLEDYYAMDPFALDMAYLQWDPADPFWLGKWRLTAGKFAPTWKNTLITYDSDTNVEGLGWNFFLDDDNWRLNLAQLQPSNTGIHLVNQVGYEGLFDALDLYATYHHVDDKAFTKIQKDMADKDKKLNNKMLLGEIADFSNYKQWELMGVLNLATLFNSDYPLKLTGNYLEASYDPVAGASERQTKGAYAKLEGDTVVAVGDWNWWLEWGRVQPNAMISLWADGDRGRGNTEFIAGGLNYRWQKNIDLGLSVIDWDRYFPKDSEEGALVVHLDAVAKF